MSYAKSVLQPGETIVAIGRLHWIIYRWAILFLVIGVALVWLGAASIGQITTGSIAVTALDVRRCCSSSLSCYAWFIRWITEFAVTNRRVISKRGFHLRAKPRR